METYLSLTDIPLKDCTAIKDANQLEETGLYRIYPGDEEGDFTTLCHMDMDILPVGVGWTIVQRRTNNSWSFQRTWEEYHHGFGEFSTNFWLGLYKIKRITDMGNYDLLVGLEDFEENYGFALYHGFHLSSEETEYKLIIEKYNTTVSTAGDALSMHNMQPFSTPNQDVEASREIHCAKESKGGWWYHSSDCFDSNLNGIWYEGHTDPNSVADGIYWGQWPGGDQKKLLRSTFMALRRV